METTEEIHPIIDRLKERYAYLRMSTQEDFEDDVDTNSPGGSSPVSTSPNKSRGKKRWSMLKSAILSIPEREPLRSSAVVSDSPVTTSSKTSTPTIEPAEEADQLLSFWKSDAISEDAPVHINLSDIGARDFSDIKSSRSRLFDEVARPPESALTTARLASAYVDEFVTESKNVSVVISKVSEEVIRKKKEELEAEVVAEKRRDIEDNVKQQANLLYLENEARQRVQRLQDQMLVKVKKEKENMVSELFSREAAIGREFRRAREVLEQDLKKEQALLMEKHGQLLSGEQSISRRYEVKWSVCPQPIEMRVHVMRAVKNKLPKGSYVVMLTQYDRLGGRPLIWSVSGAYGISKDRPATTRPFKHHGRFFDRLLKVEDSTFALCPPTERLKPGNVFIIELFQLATRRNPVNRIVGWAALPMCTPQFSVVEGRFKLPILRGEHTPSVQHYRTIEHIIGDDLNSWLCNIYIEIKHLPKFFTNSDGVSIDEYQIEFDYMKKLLSIGGGRDNSAGTNGDIENQQLKGELDPLISAPLENKGRRGNDSNPHVSKFKSMGNSKVSAGGNFPVSLEGYPEIDEENPDIEEDHYNDFSKPNLPSEHDSLLSNTNSKYGTNSHGGSGIARQRAKSSSSKSRGQFSINLGRGDHADDDSQKKNRGSSFGSLWGSLRSVFGNAKADENEPLLSGSSSVGQGSVTSGSVIRLNDARGSTDGRIWGNGQTTDEEDDDEQVEVLERGYDPEDEFFLDSQQIGKLAGLETIDKEEDRQWAASGIANGIVRRWQSDGSRYDSEAVRPPNLIRPLDLEEKRRKILGEIDEKGRYTTWTPLTDKKDFDLYSVAVAADPSRRRKLLPSALVKSKIRFIMQEAIGDLWFENFGNFDFYVTLFAYTVTLWLRMLIHYIGQYFFLQAVRTPVYSFKLTAIEIIFKYISTAVPVSYEVALVAMGPLSNIFVFVCLAVLCHLFYNIAGSLPESVSLFVCAYGVWTALDPYAILLVDLGSHNYNCGEYDDTCRDDYTSSNCNCFEGDWFKLWTRYHKDEGSGVTGFFITFMLYFSTTMVSLLLLYEYLVRVHKDARILDIWRRINAPAEDLFIPLDFEISLDELRTICASAAAWKGPDGASRRLVVSEYVETDPFDDNFEAITRHYAIYELSLDGKRKLYRHFLKLQDGSIIEIFEQLSIDLSTQYRYERRLKHKLYKFLLLTIGVFLLFLIQDFGESFRARWEIGLQIKAPSNICWNG